VDRKTIDALVADKRLHKVNPSISRAEIMIGRARKDLGAIPKVVEASEEIAYTTAFEAMFKATLALLAAHGLRLGTIEQRKAAVQFLRATLPSGLGSVLAAFDKRRQRRNDLSYDAGVVVSRTDADEALKQATILIEAIGKLVDPAIAEAKAKAKRGPGKDGPPSSR
jgi:uncharacterized protein (UPF0332 family)